MHVAPAALPPPANRARTIQMFRPMDAADLPALPERYRRVLARLESLIRRHACDPVAGFAFAKLDLDHFHRVNARFGTEAGDTLLETVERRLQRAVGARGLAARSGGDRFVLVIEDVRPGGALARARQLVAQALSAPFSLHDEEVFLAGTLGVVAAGEDYASRDSLVRDADTAVRHAKLGRRGAAAQFTAHMRNDASEGLRLESDLRAAIRRDQMELFYQPILSADGAIIAFEGLLRWRHPERGLLAPAAFLPAMHESGLIVEAGYWGIREACRHARRLADAGIPVPVSVNLSARQLEDPGLLDAVGRALAAAGASPSMLLFEITEEALLEQPGETAGVLAALRALGVSLLMDDFGTGYSSLAYLRDLPVDVIKIARPLLMEVEQPGARREIVRTVVQLAHALGLHVVAEGVETAAQLHAVRELGCDWVQGYHLGHPLDTAAAMLWAVQHGSGGS